MSPKWVLSIIYHREHIQIVLIAWGIAESQILSQTSYRTGHHISCVAKRPHLLCPSVSDHVMLTPPSNLMRSFSSRIFSWQTSYYHQVLGDALEGSVSGKIALVPSYKLVIHYPAVTAVVKPLQNVDMVFPAYVEVLC